jgi:hypothetical protein
LLLGIILYLALLPLWWVALDLVTFVTASLAHWIYHFFDPQVTIDPDGKVARVFVSAAEQSGFTKLAPYQLSLRMDTITYGMPMLAALVIVTRADSPSARARAIAKARAMASGLLAMSIFTVFAVMMWAKLATLQQGEQTAQAMFAGGRTRAGFFYYAFHGYAFSQPVFAVCTWFALMMLGLFRPGRLKQGEIKQKGAQEKPAPASVSRNALCSCGSGRKYKRCCGRS